MQLSRTKFRKSFILSNKKWIKCFPGKNPVNSRGKSGDITQEKDAALWHSSQGNSSAAGLQQGGRAPSNLGFKFAKVCNTLPGLLQCSCAAKLRQSPSAAPLGDFRHLALSCIAMESLSVIQGTCLPCMCRGCSGDSS